MRHVTKYGLLLTIILLLTACFNIPLGDGNKLKLGKDGVTFTDEEGDETKIAVDKDEGQINISGGKDGDEVDLSFGEDLDLPATFPKDMPLTEDATIHQSTTTKGGKEWAVSYSTKESLDSVTAMYLTYLEANYAEVGRQSDQVEEMRREFEEEMQGEEGYEELEDLIASSDYLSEGYELIFGKKDNVHIGISLIFNEDAQDEIVEEEAGLVTIIYTDESE